MSERASGFVAQGYELWVGYVVHWDQHDLEELRDCASRSDEELVDDLDGPYPVIGWRLVEGHVPTPFDPITGESEGTAVYDTTPEKVRKRVEVSRRAERDAAREKLRKITGE